MVPRWAVCFAVCWSWFGALAVLLPGCSSGPSAIDAPDLDADAATTLAMEAYDANGDGTLAGEELDSAGSLTSGLATIDTNADGKISREELAAALTRIAGGGVGLTSFSCKVTLDGKPLADANVKFVPETFMQDAILPATGTTDASGVTVVACDSSQLPEGQQDLNSVIHPGFYRVEITHPQQQLPAKYNSATTLGQLVAPESGALGTPSFDLQSR